MADERDPGISRHYRGLESLEPPGELDRTIVGAARGAVSGRHRWYYSLAAAAVLVFAVALTLHMERERADPEGAPQLRLARELRGEIKPAPEAQSQPAEVQPRLARPAEPAPRFAPASPEMPRDAAEAKRDRAGSPPSPSSAVAQTMPSQQADEAAARREASNAQRATVRQMQAEHELRRQSAVAALAPREEAPPAVAPSTAAPPAREKPEPWLERIAELRSRGRHAEADKEFADFRRVYPDYRLSEIMRERVEGR